METPIYFLIPQDYINSIIITNTNTITHPQTISVLDHHFDSVIPRNPHHTALVLVLVLVLLMGLMEAPSRAAAAAFTGSSSMALVLMGPLV